MSLKEFFIEGRRRNIFRVALAYSVTAWLLIQIATQTFPFFEIPNWCVRLVIVLLALGFPIAIILRWTYELTPNGLERRENVTVEKPCGRKTNCKQRTIPKKTRLWDLAGLLFDRKTRAEVYEPVINEIREDFLLARRCCRSRANYRWVRACFAIRGSLAFIRCLRISILRPIVSLIPSKLKQLWKLFS